MRDVRFCARCVMPNTRPRIVFDALGVCNGCRFAEEKSRIDWTARRRDFEALIEAGRGRGTYDCIVPWSGGKDSSTIAHRLKAEFGLNPLLVTFSPLIPNAIGARNREAFLNLGFDSIMIRPNQKASRRLARRFLEERGNPKVHWDAGVNAAPVRSAVEQRVPLVLYAEHGESEYGGRVLSEDHRRMRDLTEVLEHQIGDDPANWTDEVIGPRDLAPYLYPAAEDVACVGVKALYFGWFFRWSMAENWQYIQGVMPFATAPNGRTDGTFTNFDSLDDAIDDLYYHLQYIKFGFGRATRDACRMVQNGELTRAEALEKVRAYDDEFPSTHLAEALDYLGLDEAGLARILDTHRNDEIWVFEGNRWRLRHPPR
ncbi:MAG: N-acetyl sugar amidotransferase [Alphaproteobacteria bacterium]